MARSWSLPGSGGELILGNTDFPPNRVMAAVLVAHGFKGYKDYGMIPRLSETLARAGCVVHRFNFSHSGMTESVATFERPDLFEEDTWNRQVEDLRCLANAITSGRLEGAGVPLFLVGHSRGGASCLLAAGRRGDQGPVVRPAGVITIATPASCNPLPAREQEVLLREGSLLSPSSRTGQQLRVGRRFLEEQLDDPEGHDLLAVASSIECPVLVVHGSNDETVPSTAARELADAVGPRATTLIVEGADHVFNTPNPMPRDAHPSPQLAALCDAAVGFVRQHCVL
ncbi:MAG: alpha/beta fold hydrolase [Phycisphaerales bacterium]|nr:alpha/beta fold hydrolase [Phycisphaerales bacterium]